MTWLEPPYYREPNEPVLPPPNEKFGFDGSFATVEFDIEYGMGLVIDPDLGNPNYFFNNNPALDAMYASPLAYVGSIVAKAKSIQAGEEGTNRKYYFPDGWTPTEAGVKYANIVFAKLKQIPCNRGDEASNNLLDSWAAGTGQNYGGHPNPTAGTL